MWNYRTCPVCDSSLDIVDFHGSEIRLRCAQNPIVLSYRTVYHFETLVRGFEPWHETITVYPYVIDSYKDVSNISVYDRNDLCRFVVEVPHYLDLPWHKLDKVKDKLKLYMLMS